MKARLGFSAYVDRAMGVRDDTRDQRFAVNLDRIIRERKLVARRIARSLDLGESEFSRYRLGKVVPPVSVAADIAAEMNISLDELMAPLPARPLPTTRAVEAATETLLEAARGSEERRAPAAPLPGGRRRSDPPPRA